MKTRPTTLAFLVLLLTSAGIASAQEAPAPATPRLERLEISIWPEYDQPSVLVMLRGFLSPDTPLPTSVPLPIPAAAGSPSAVAKRFPGGDLLVAQSMLEAGDPMSTVYISTDAPEIRLEYYIPLDLGNENRHYHFEWPGGLAADRVLFEVMQPIGATGFVVQPASSAPALANDGLIYQREDLGPAAVDQTFAIEIDYTKSSPMLTANAMQSAVPQTPAQTFQSPASVPTSGAASQA
ncbi:MAG: hypothetical protein WBO71_12605, partial [Thermoanaerobaculia bacterium]